MGQQSFKNFLKTLPFEAGEGLVNKLVRPPHNGQAFWDFRPFTRLLKWGKDYKTAMIYVLKNTKEALGFVKYTPRARNYVYEKYLK